jgi:hypothetical protein
MRYKDVRFQLGERTLRDREMMQIVAQVVSTVPLCDVGRDSGSRPLNLTRQSVQFVPRRIFREAVTFHHKVNRLLPHLEIAVAPNWCSFDGFHILHLPLLFP